MPELQNRKHERFAQEYILDYNATAAALRTGYKESNARAQGSTTFMVVSWSMLASCIYARKEKTAPQFSMQPMKRLMM